MAHASRELRLVTIAAEMEKLQKQRNGMKQGLSTQAIASSVPTLD
jgi:hypothetical protein